VTTLDHPLVGSWRLRSWVAISDDGSEATPMGEEPSGLLAYTGDGTMVTVIGTGDRPRFASNDATGGTDEERAQAVTTFVAYGGRFEIDGDVVDHHVEASLFPNWVGTTQRRRWELDEAGRWLTLTSPPVTLGGGTRLHRLVWERARD